MGGAPREDGSARNGGSRMVFASPGQRVPPHSAGPAAFHHAIPAPSGIGGDRGWAGGEGKAAPKRVMLPDGWASMAVSGPALTGVVKALGVSGLTVKQWYNVDVPEGTCGKVHALLLFYKWRLNRAVGVQWNASHAVGYDDGETSGGRRDDILLINQLINGASGTQALVSALLNVARNSSMAAGAEFDVGERVRKLLKFVESLPPIVRAAAATSSKAVWTAHETAAKSHGRRSLNADLVDDAACLKSGQDFWLYSVYLPGRSGKWVYEMEGCGHEPNVLGSFSPGEYDADNEWVGVVTDPLEGFIKEMRSHHVPFELYALVDDASEGENMEGSDGDEEKDDGLKRENGHMRDSQNVGLLSDERMLGGERGASCRKRKRAIDDETMEMERRIATHNYDNFFVEMLKLMASKGQLNSIIERICKEGDRCRDGDQDGLGRDGSIDKTNAGETDSEDRAVRKPDRPATYGAPDLRRGDVAEEDPSDGADGDGDGDAEADEVSEDEEDDAGEDVGQADGQADDRVAVEDEDGEDEIDEEEDEEDGAEEEEGLEEDEVEEEEVEEEEVGGEDVQDSEGDDEDEESGVE